MSSASLQLGGDNWAAKDGNLLGYQRSSSSSVHIPHEFTFTRGSDIAATRINSSGLIEKYRENLLLQSNQFDNTTWIGRSQTTLTGGQIGYDGSNDAWSCATTSGGQIMGQNIVNQGVQTISVYAKGSVSNGLRIFAFGNDNVDFWVNLNTGLPDGGISSKVIDYSIEDVNGNGEWYRCSFTFNQTTSSIYFYCTDNNRSNAAGTIYIQDVQLEKGLVATSYLESGATTAKAGVLDNLPRIDYTGGTASLLLEPSRTNLITNSEYIDNSTDWTVPLVNVIIEKNSITSPERQTNATKLTGSGGSAQRRIYQSFSQLSGQNFTASIFAKEDTENILFLRLYNTTDNVYANASFNLSTGAINSNDSGTAKIENYGNGWYRCILTGTPSTTTTTGGAYFNLTDDGNTTSTTSLYLWGAQVEQASYATSYIPTYGTSVTRNADGFQKTGASGVIGQTEGTLYIEAIFKEEGNLSQWFSLTDGTANNWVFIGKDNDDIRGYIRANNIVAFSNQTFQITNNTVVKAALSYKSGSISLYINGSLIASSTNSFSFNQPLDTIYSTTYNNQDAREKVDLDRMLIFKTALTNAECISLTTL